MITIYGIKNCNTMQKVVKILEEKQIPFVFHDYKKEGITEKEVAQWIKQVGWEILVNKKGTTWRKLSPEEQAGIVDEPSALKALVQHTSMIKRPVMVSHKKVIAVGFDEVVLEQLKP